MVVLVPGYQAGTSKYGTHGYFIPYHQSLSLYYHIRAKSIIIIVYCYVRTSTVRQSVRRYLLPGSSTHLRTETSSHSFSHASSHTSHKKVPCKRLRVPRKSVFHASYFELLVFFNSSMRENMRKSHISEKYATTSLLTYYCGPVQI